MEMLELSKKQYSIISYMDNNSEFLEVTLQYTGSKAGRLLSGITSRYQAFHILLADLTALRTHRPKGENIRQEGATFFLSWPHPLDAAVPLAKVCPTQASWPCRLALKTTNRLIRCQGTLYRRWLNVARGSPELDAVKEKLSM